MTTRLVVLGEQVSAWIEKGEVIDRYFNPGNVFDEVHLMVIRGDVPAAESVQRMAGSAEVTITSLPTTRHLFLRTAGYRPRLLEVWSRPVVRAIASKRPHVIRTYGTSVLAFAAAIAGRRLQVPVVTSVHINPDVDVRARSSTLKDKARAVGSRKMEAEALRAAQLVLPVYKSIVPFLESRKVVHHRVAYNMSNPSNLAPKQSYALHSPPRILCVGRQFREKDPTPIIRAVTGLPDVELVVVGDGPLHNDLVILADSVRAGQRIRFRRAVPNDELCAELANFDLFTVHSEYWELSKVTLEALLAGLPVVHNRRSGEPVPELTPDICCLTDGSPEGYRDAIRELLADDARRAALGRRGRRVADEHWSPQRTEDHFAGIYRELLQSPVQ